MMRARGGLYVCNRSSARTLLGTGLNAQVNGRETSCVFMFETVRQAVTRCRGVKYWSSRTTAFK